MRGRSKALRYLTVEISGEHVRELDDAGPIVTVVRRDIESIELRHGRVSERPLRQWGCGIVCLLAGIGCLALFFFAKKAELPGRLLGVGIGIAVVLFGVWVLASILKRSFYLRVATANDARNLVFYGKVDRAILQSFVEAAYHDLSYGITSAIPDLPTPATRRLYR